MIRQVVTLGPIVAGNAALLVASVTPTSGTALTLLTNSLGTVPRRILATVGSEASGRTLKLTGTNYAGLAITETLTIPASTAGTVQSTQDFATITQALPLGGGWTAAMTLGTSGVASSPWQRVSEHITPVNIGVSAVVNGTANYTVEVTAEAVEAVAANSTAGAPQGPGGPVIPNPTPFPYPPALQAQSTNQAGMIDRPITSWRVTLNSGTGSVTVTAVEAGIRQGG